MIKGTGMTYREFEQKFPTDKAAIDYFLDVRYHGVITCPHCGQPVQYRYQKRAKIFHCYHCKNTFSPFKDTIFAKTHIGMRMWFFAIHLFMNGRKGFSACQLQRELGVSYPTAWRMFQQIRVAMGNEDMSKAFKDIVEIDETYVGGKPRKNNTIIDHEGHIIYKDMTKAKRGRGTKKTPIVGVKERSTGRVYAQVALPNENGEKLSGKQMLTILDEVCEDDTTVMTDDAKEYNILDKATPNNFHHFSVNHSLGQYSAGNGINTNGIENFWAIFKRGWYGTYHHMSLKYMQRYINEFCYRQNTRNIPAAFDLLLSRAVLHDIA
jgi:transposase-like protein